MRHGVGPIAPREAVRDVKYNEQSEAMVNDSGRSAWTIQYGANPARMLDDPQIWTLGLAQAAIVISPKGTDLREETICPVEYRE